MRSSVIQAALGVGTVVERADAHGIYAMALALRDVLRMRAMKLGAP